MAFDAESFANLFQVYGKITVRRMFGGAGLFVDGLMIGIVMNDQIYLKTDDESRDAFLAEGCKPFTFAKAGSRVSLRFYSIPDRLLDDAEEFAAWARIAERVARAKAVKKAAKKKVTKA